MSNIKELKSKFNEKYRNIVSDQKLGKPKPSIEKPYPLDVELIMLSKDFKVSGLSLLVAMQNRKSRRKFSGNKIALDELSFLLWATQGVRNSDNPIFRTVPSAGARHPLETYLVVHKVEGLQNGLYRYLPIEHALYCIEKEEAIVDKLKVVIPSSNPISMGLDNCAITFLWAAIPYRTEWRYPGMGVKVIGQDAGHVCQNLYLAVEAINSGVCAVDAYVQDAADELLCIDGQDEFTVYMAVVGKVI
ncbi:MAG: SagB/ThcOx family dehydrogenase [Gammaproteobacteria bacterium]|nr:SagB/ThcOx family dehydrogenase [Gammaproteobacteria bacterium]